MKKTITGFHAIEEKLRSFADGKLPDGVEILYSQPGPRVKKILEEAKKNGVPCKTASKAELDKAVNGLNEVLQNHRGIVMVFEASTGSTQNRVSFDEFIASAKGKSDSAEKISVVVILDSVTDPHNVGAIIRSADQFGADLVVLPDHRGAKDSEVIERSSAGAASWVPVSVVTNLVRAVEQLKDAGYWIYGADAGGTPAHKCKLSGKIAVVMGSEGNGISRLLSNSCDGIISIPTCGKLDSLNVSVAAGVILYEIARQNLQQ